MIWNISVLNIKGKINKIAIKLDIYIFIIVCFHSHFTDVINIDIVNAFDMDHMAHKYLFVKRGGHSSPKDCKSYQKVAIIVPYRDRMHHLKILLNRLHPMLYKQQIEYRIFLVEQVCWWSSIIAIYHLLPIQCSPLIEYHCTCFIWACKLCWLYKFVLYTVTDRNIAFSGTSSTCYLLSIGNLIVHPVHFLLTENIKRGNQGIII